MSRMLLALLLAALPALVSAQDADAPTDARRATDGYERACQAGDAAACAAAGRMYEGKPDTNPPGGTIPRYHVAALHYHQRACQQGLAASCDAFERLMRLDGRDADCERGDVAACKEVGDHAFGMSPFVDRPDYARAARMYERACTLGDMDACAALGVLYQSGGPKAGPDHAAVRDYDKARHYYRLACDGGREGSCLGLQVVDVLQAAESGCAAGEAAACRELAWRTSLGNEVPRDPVRAADLARRACDGGDALGCALLGVFLADGQGVPPDPAGARAMFLRARALAPDDPVIRKVLDERGIR